MTNKTGELSVIELISRNRWEMCIPYNDESCYIDVAHGDGLVVVFENKLRFVRNYPVSQIIDLIEEGVTYITPDQLIAI